MSRKAESSLRRLWDELKAAESESQAAVDAAQDLFLANLSSVQGSLVLSINAVRAVCLSSVATLQALTLQRISGKADASVLAGIQSTLASLQNGLNGLQGEVGRLLETRTPEETVVSADQEEVSIKGPATKGRLLFRDTDRSFVRVIYDRIKEGDMIMAVVERAEKAESVPAVRATTFDGGFDISFPNPSSNTVVVWVLI